MLYFFGSTFTFSTFLSLLSEDIWEVGKCLNFRLWSPKTVLIASMPLSRGIIYICRWATALNWDLQMWFVMRVREWERSTIRWSQVLSAFYKCAFYICAFGHRRILCASFEQLKMGEWEIEHQLLLCACVASLYIEVPQPTTLTALYIEVAYV